MAFVRIPSNEVSTLFSCKLGLEWLPFELIQERKHDCSLAAMLQRPAIRKSCGQPRFKDIPQEMFNEISSYLDPLDLISLKASCRDFSYRVCASFHDLHKQMDGDFVDRFLLRCYLENPRANDLMCILCHRPHNKGAFFQDMQNKPATIRFCRQIRDSVLDFGSSSISFDHLRECGKSMRSDRYWQEYSDTSGMSPLENHYPEDRASPALYRPFGYGINKSGSYPAYPTLAIGFSPRSFLPLCYAKDVFVEQDLTMKQNHLIVMSKAMMHVESFKQIRDRVSYHSNRVHSTPTDLDTPRGFRFCPHVYCPDERIRAVAKSVVQAFENGEEVGYQTFCRFCQARIRIFAKYFWLFFETMKDLGPCKVEQDPLWARHTSLG